MSHPEKVMFPADGITKGELAAYYEAIAPLMLPHIAGRPITMERFPSGIEAKGFMQKDVSRGAPAWLERATVPKRGGVVHHALVSDLRSLLWLANQNCVTPHVPCARAPDLGHPDVCVVDLDPARDEPEVLRAAVLAVRDLLAEVGMASWVKTSGSKGFHVLVPLDGEADHDDLWGFAEALARRLVERDPDHLTLEFTKADRGGRIYVDVGRNAPSATYAAPYAVRPRDGAPVSAPCTWAEVEGGIEPRSVALRDMPARIAEVGDAWAGMLEARQSLTEATARLGQG
jgi:bifunctional non-homologous end joining protein LigD